MSCTMIQSEDHSIATLAAIQREHKKRLARIAEAGKAQLRKQAQRLARRELEDRLKELETPEPIITNPFAVAWQMLDGLDVGAIRRVQNRVCEHFGLSREMMLSHRRTAELVMPRHIAMYICKTSVSKSLPSIGHAFRGRDHTTVLHAVRKIERLIAQDPEISSVVAKLESELQLPGGK